MRVGESDLQRFTNEGIFYVENCCGLAQVDSSVPHSFLLAPCPLQWDGEGNRKGKSEETQGLR